MQTYRISHLNLKRSVFLGMRRFTGVIVELSFPFLTAFNFASWLSILCLLFCAFRYFSATCYFPIHFRSLANEKNHD